MPVTVLIDGQMDRYTNYITAVKPDLKSCFVHAPKVNRATTA